MSADYEDAYLKAFVTTKVQQRAYEEVDLYGTFTDEWRDRLVVPQAYVIVCLEHQGTADDLFSQKLKNYQKELDRLVAHARAAVTDSGGNSPSIFGVPLERS